MQTRRHAVVGAVVAVTALGSPAVHADGDPDEVRATRASGLVVHDGKGHYVAFQVADPTTPIPTNSDVLFYGDGKTFYRQPLNGAQANAINEGQRKWNIRDDRLGLELDKSKLEFDLGVYKMTCRDKETTLRVLDPKEARKLLAKAVFKPRRMDRIAWAVGRDGTTYYFVDSVRGEKPGDWRVFVGKRGSLKLLTLKDVAADAGGQVFTASTGTLRVNTKTEALSWEPKRGKQVQLTSVPVDNNLTLIYAELGVYTTGFGVPCDDL